MAQSSFDGKKWTASHTGQLLPVTTVNDRKRTYMRAKSNINSKQAKLKKN